MKDSEIEAVMIANGSSSLRLTPAMIDALIVDQHYWNPEGTSLTVCVLVLKNGYTVTGESACIDLANFNDEIGRSIAFGDARQKIWSLQGYLLKETAYNQSE